MANMNICVDYELKLLDLRIEPFYSAVNQMHLEKIISDYEAGVSKPVVKTIEELAIIANE